MADHAFVLLDTKAFDRAIEENRELLNSCYTINQTYDQIVSDLLNNWKGRGASAFQKDAQAVRANLTGIFDILKIMNDTLVDCRTIFAECDTSLGEYNRNPGEEA